MPKKEKLLSDKILDFINPAPVHFDPEADIHTETAAKIVENDFDEDDLSDDGALSVFRKRNVQLIEEIDPRYAGKKVTRESIGSFTEKRKKSSSSEDDDDDDEDDEQQPSDEEANNFVDKADIADDEENDDSDDDGSGESEGGSDESENGEDLSGVEVDDSDEEDANISQDFVHLATKDTGAEIDKGKAIQTQLSLWDGLLEARISLQKVMVAANKLPQPEEKDLFVEKGGKEFTKAAKTTQKDVSKLLDKLIELREHQLRSFSEIASALYDKNGEANGETGSSEDKEERNGESKSEETKPSRKRKLEEYGEVLTKHHSEFADYRNTTIQRWNDKTRVTTGKLSNRNFSGFEQPTLRQIEQIMSNMPRLVARTRLKRSAYRTLGKPAVEVDPSKPPPEDIDREIFDDSDFYHLQLRELIERKTNGDPMGRQMLAMQSARAKMKRKVDTSASKGRRLRYTPHAKLLGFMAAIPELPCNFDARNELYLSLFGAKRV